MMGIYEKATNAFVIDFSLSQIESSYPVRILAEWTNLKGDGANYSAHQLLVIAS